MILLKEKVESGVGEELGDIKNRLHNYHDLFYFLRDGEEYDDKLAVPSNSFYGELRFSNDVATTNFKEYCKEKYNFSLSEQWVLRFQNQRNCKFRVALFSGEGLDSYGKLLISQKSIRGKAQKQFEQVQAILSGTCLFGKTIFGTDEEGSYHDLLTLNAAEEVSIKKIIYTMDELHPYEILFQNIFSHSVSLFHVISKQQVPELYFVVPEHNYVYKILQLYVRGQLPKEEVITFMHKVHERAENVRNFLIKLCENHNINLTFVSSLSPLFKDIKVGDVDALLARLGCSHFSKESMKEREAEFLSKTMNFLCEDTSVIGELWHYLKYNKQDEFDISNIDKTAYAVDAAIVIKSSNYRSFLFYDQIEEELAYRNFYRLFGDYLFQGTEDVSINFLAYLLPIVPQEAKCLYYLRQDLAKPLAKLMEKEDLFSTLSSKHNLRTF